MDRLNHFNGRPIFIEHLLHGKLCRTPFLVSPHDDAASELGASFAGEEADAVGGLCHSPKVTG